MDLCNDSLWVLVAQDFYRFVNAKIILTNINIYIILKLRRVINVNMNCNQRKHGKLKLKRLILFLMKL